MKPPKFFIWFIFILTILAVIVDLPKNFNLKFTLGPIKIDRIIRNPDINFAVGPFAVKKDLSTKYGLDLSGGTHLVLEADMKDIATSDREKAFDSSRNIVERRVNLYGLTEPVVQQAKVGESHRILVEIPGVSDVSQAIDLIGRTAQLSFREEASDSARVATPSSAFEVWPKLTSLTGKNLKRADVAFDPQSGKPQPVSNFSLS